MLSEAKHLEALAPDASLSMTRLGVSVDKELASLFEPCLTSPNLL